MKRLWVVLVLVVFVAAGCAKKETVQPEAQPQQQQAEKSAAAEKVTEQKVGTGSETITSKDTEGAEASKEGMFQDVHFDFDKYDIKEADKATLKSIASFMAKEAKARLSVEGHCDDRGTNEYNLALGDRRAKAVRDYLLSLGVSSSRIDTISYGEEKPLCKEQTEDCWAQNRRGHFVVLGK